MKIIVKYNNDHKELNASKNISLLELLRENNLYITAPCGGRGLCGKCRIKVLKGNLQISLKDELFFSIDELNKGYRLACSAFPTEDLVIIMESYEDTFEVLTSYEERNELADCGIELHEICIEDINWLEIKSIQEALDSTLETPLKLTNKSLKGLSKAFNERIKTFGYSKIILKLLIEKDRIVDVFFNEPFEIYGIAIDIGTTTIGYNLVDMKSGRILGGYSSLNSQRTFGADVISRILAASNGNLDKLNQLIISDILTGIEKLLSKHTIDVRFIYKISIAGNTTMQHLLLGLSPESLGQYPFTSTSLALLKFSFQEIFKSSILDCEVVLLPGMDAYVGADIVAGILYNDLFCSKKVNMLIDIGTNGEIVIGNMDAILATATAAGPALEGGNISCGVGSVSGAITSVKYINGLLDYDVLGDQAPIGICGSGIIDIIAEGLNNGWIDETGRLSQDFTDASIKICDASSGEIKLTQKDIREVQLAKSALSSGIECLIHAYGITFNEIDKVYLAGGFGSGLSVKNAVKIGLIPRALIDKIKISGNTSLGGAVKFLLDQTSKSSMDRILKISKTINLSANSNFNNLFIDNMYF